MASQSHLRIRRAADRARTRLDWLDSRHTFSFGHHHDADWMGHSDLRVLNQDVVAPGGGFDWHSHRDMEIVSYVLSGALRHQDDMGNDHTIRAGEVQRMTAGTGVTHREWNAADTATEFLQMWVLPDRRGRRPSYDQKQVYLDASTELVPIGGPDGPVLLHADARLYAGRAAAGATLRHDLARAGWLHVATGAVRLGDLQLQAGDGVGLEAPQELVLEVTEGAELVLWDLPARQST